MARFSVLYLLKEQYHHIGCATHEEAQAALQQLLTYRNRTPIGIYDAKTELFEWEATRQYVYDHVGINLQGKADDQIITITQSLRRRDSGNTTQWSSLLA